MSCKVINMPEGVEPEVFSASEHIVTVDGDDIIIRRRSNTPQKIKSAVMQYDAIMQLLNMSCATLRAEGVSQAFKDDLADRIEELAVTLDTSKNEAA